jgi:hypothetical protein
VSATRDLTLWRDGLPPWLARDHVAIPPGAPCACTDPEWRDALAVVEHGTIVLASRGGGELVLAQGAVFSLAGLEGATLRSAGATPALVSRGRRRAAP